MFLCPLPRLFGGDARGSRDAFEPSDVWSASMPLLLIDACFLRMFWRIVLAACLAALLELCRERAGDGLKTDFTDCFLSSLGGGGLSGAAFSTMPLMTVRTCIDTHECTSRPISSSSVPSCSATKCLNSERGGASVAPGAGSGHVYMAMCVILSSKVPPSSARTSFSSIPWYVTSTSVTMICLCDLLDVLRTSFSSLRDTSMSKGISRASSRAVSLLYVSSILPRRWKLSIHVYRSTRKMLIKPQYITTTTTVPVEPFPSLILKWNHSRADSAEHVPARFLIIVDVASGGATHKPSSPDSKSTIRTRSGSSAHTTPRSATHT
mmetsp:Transcript_249/g.685  ORF Transcript_249/g.685 Transcript_249/m.685 type:complete len:322 (-) Transcript_249:545-1510(-)